ncbi:cysteine dioxygenase family protein [Saccharopolyspora hordei]|uniref:Putative metal-dependent enzyme (Double-stranded beta helix superfamily) n=1 Tax=Saccharopolyspora hordei TaxID=1838 RepID=A0A853AH31_9PSEU|nr:putative metal-dependent enzyme (double-stranded beta helix superfamily) [Saccharopolyspora hordei]
MFAVPPGTVAAPADLTTAHPVRIARELAADRGAWAHLLRYDPDQRWFELITRTEHHEAWLLSWLPGQHTELHDHGGATGAFTVVSGDLTERVVRASGAEVLHRLTTGQSRVFGPDYVHQVSNTGQDPAVSIHVYRPVRAPMRTYEHDPVHGLRPRA